MLTFPFVRQVCKIDPPLEQDIETAVGLGFDSMRKVNTSSAASSLPVFSGIDREGFVHYSMTTPDVSSWIEYFDDLLDYYSRHEQSSTITTVFNAAISKLVPLHMQRSAEDEAFMNLSIPAAGRLRATIDEENLQVTAHRSWKNVVQLLNNVSATPPFNKSIKVAKNLELDWVYGFNGHSSGQCLLYGAQGEVIYPAASIVVIQIIATHTQRYFSQHNDFVSCMTGKLLLLLFV
jgi:hypothetical protein